MLASVISNAYFYIAVGSSLFFILQSVLTFIGIGDNFELDSDFDAEVDPGIDIGDGISLTMHLFTIRGIIAFFMVFGWSGFLLTNTEMNGIIVFLISLGTGTIMLVLIGLVYYFFERISSEGNLDLVRAVGKTGSVYIPIPKRGSGIGKVQIVIDESLRTLDALSTSSAIKTGTQVKVVGVNNDMLEVEEIKEEIK